jgi:hypothetical protein
MPNMIRSARPKRAPVPVRRKLAALGLFLFAIRLVAQTPPPPPVRTPFENVPPSDPRREIIQTVLDSPGYTTGLMTEAMWRAGDFHGAWQRVGQFFTQRVSFTTARDQFLTHFFNPLGYQELEIFDSDYLRMCVGNRLTFTREGVVGAYRGMREGDAAGAASFS